MNVFRKNRGIWTLSTILFVLIIYALADVPPAQDESLETVLKQRMKLVREKSRGIRAREFVEKYGYNVVAAADPYLNDPNPKVRGIAFGLVWQAGMSSKVKAERQSVVEKLLDHRGKYPEIKDSVSDRLFRFKDADFSKAAKQSLLKELKAAPEYRTILLVGAADVNEALPLLKEMVGKVQAPDPLKPFGADRKPGHSLAFAALMARGRMGIKEDVRRAIEVVEAHPDEKFKVIVLLKRLSYVRQPEVVDYLKKYVFMDGFEPGPETQMRMTIAQRAMLPLAEMLDDFPGREGTDLKFGSLEETTAYVREWMNKQKKWNIRR